MPFTLRNLREDLADVGSNFDGAPDLEFRAASKALELSSRASAISASRPATGFRTATRTSSRRRCSSSSVGAGG
jgi:hypothetical protein